MNLNDAQRYEQHGVEKVECEQLMVRCGWFLCGEREEFGGIETVEIHQRFPENERHQGVIHINP